MRFPWGKREQRIRRDFEDDLRAAQASSQETARRIDRAIERYRLLTELTAAEGAIRE